MSFQKLKFYINLQIARIRRKLPRGIPEALDVFNAEVRNFLNSSNICLNSHSINFYPISV